MKIFYNLGIWRLQISDNDLIERGTPLCVGTLVMDVCRLMLGLALSLMRLKKAKSVLLWCVLCITVS